MYNAFVHTNHTYKIPIAKTENEMNLYPGGNVFILSVFFVTNDMKVLQNS